MSRWRSHLNIGAPLIIEGEEVMIKSLGMSYLDDVIAVQKRFVPLVKDVQEKGDKVTGEVLAKLMGTLDDDTITRMKRLVLDTFKVSCPEDCKTEEDMKEVDAVCARNFWQIFFKVMEVNSNTKGQDRNAAALEALRNRNAKLV